MEARDTLEFLAHYQHRSDPRWVIQARVPGLTGQGREGIGCRRSFAADGPTDYVRFREYVGKPPVLVRGEMNEDVGILPSLPNATEGFPDPTPLDLIPGAGDGDVVVAGRIDGLEFPRNQAERGGHRDHVGQVRPARAGKAPGELSMGG